MKYKRSDHLFSSWQVTQLSHLTLFHQIPAWRPGMSVASGTQSAALSGLARLQVWSYPSQSTKLPLTVLTDKLIHNIGDFKHQDTNNTLRDHNSQFNIACHYCIPGMNDHRLRTLLDSSKNMPIQWFFCAATRATYSWIFWELIKW